MAENFPDLDFPEVDEGRSHREVALTDDAVYFVGAVRGDRPNSHRAPAFSRLEALTSQSEEILERERKLPDPCINCGRRPIKVKKRGLCGTCDEYRRTHRGQLRQYK